MTNNIPNKKSILDLKSFLDEKVYQYNNLNFIDNDPISIPHQFTKKQDIEIAGLISAIFAWGLRKTAIKKGFEFMQRMDNNPHQFILNHSSKDIKAFNQFKHRTFNDVDAIYFIQSLKNIYTKYESLEDVFYIGSKNDETIESGLIHFHKTFFSLPDYPQRTQKHISTPARNSSCKRINMYLRWMVRNDNKGVDFGIWKKISPTQLICPTDVHVCRVANQLGWMDETFPVSWKTALQLTSYLRILDPKDPVKYDFALFGLGIFENWKNEI